MKKLEGRKMNKIILIYNWKTKKEESFPAYLDKLGVKYRVFDNADDSEHRLTKWHKIINTFPASSCDCSGYHSGKGRDDQ